MAALLLRIIVLASLAWAAINAGSFGWIWVSDVLWGGVLIALGVLLIEISKKPSANGVT